MKIAFITPKRIVQLVTSHNASEINCFDLVLSSTSSNVRQNIVVCKKKPGIFSKRPTLVALNNLIVSNAFLFSLSPTVGAVAMVV